MSEEFFGFCVGGNVLGFKVSDERRTLVVVILNSIRTTEISVTCGDVTNFLILSEMNKNAAAFSITAV